MSFVQEMFGLIKKAFTALLSFSGSLVSITNLSNFTKLNNFTNSLNNQPYITRPKS